MPAKTLETPPLAPEPVPQTSEPITPPDAHDAQVVQPLDPVPAEVQVWETPHTSRQVNALIQGLDDRQLVEPVTFRHVLRKLCRGIDQLQGENWSKDLRIKDLEQQNQALQPLAKRTVKKDPNRAFATVAEIEEARDAARGDPRATAAVPTANLAVEAAEIAQRKLEDMCFQFQLEKTA